MQSDHHIRDQSQTKRLPRYLFPQRSIPRFAIWLSPPVPDPGLEATLPHSPPCLGAHGLDAGGLWLFTEAEGALIDYSAPLVDVERRRGVSRGSSAASGEEKPEQDGNNRELPPRYPVHLSHAPRTEGRDHFVVTETSTCF